MAQVALRKVFRGNGLMSAIFQTSGTNLLVMTLTMLSSILTSRMFGVEGKGAFSAILFWPALLTGLVGFGLPTSIIYNIKQSATEKSAQYVRLSFLFQVPVCIIIGIVAWFGLPFWLSSFPPEVVQISRWYTIATVPVLIVINLISALSQSREKFAVYNGIRLMIPLFNVGGLFVLWGLGMLSIQLAAAIYFVTSFSVVAWAIYANRNELRLRWFKDRVDQSSAKKLFGYGSRVYGVELLGTLYTQFDKIIILALLTPRDFGLYSVVFALSRIYNAVQTAISNVVFPKVTGLPQEQIIRTVGRAFRISLMVMMIIVIPTMFVGNYLMGLLFGSEFLEASVAFYILAVECIIGGGSWILASAFNALGRPGLVMIRQLIALSVTVALFFVFTPLWGSTELQLPY